VKKVKIEIDPISISMRDKVLNTNTKSILISNLKGSNQEKDIKKELNCDGYGRIRTFRLGDGIDWIQDPLPILPVNQYLNTNYMDSVEAQVFQLNACNYRCWYCFVDNANIAGRKESGKFFTTDELVDMYLSEKERAPVIDLSGGQPDLVPEWTPWMMRSLIERKIQNDLLLWSDDNLSTDFFWRFLTDSEISLIESYKNYCRVCCFKGIDPYTYSINTGMQETRFKVQFELFKRLMELNIDLYGYITLTSPVSTDFKNVIPRLFDTFQELHEDLPLRIIPLKIYEYTPVLNRKISGTNHLLEGQKIAMQFWRKELKSRFSEQKRNAPITDISINK
jgi:uncharacterized Fe-S cluster-containing radical SAM superfamily protein